MWYNNNRVKGKALNSNEKVMYKTIKRKGIFIMNERKNAWVKETVARMRTAEKNDPASVGAVIVNNEKVIVTITKNIDNPRIGVAMVNGNDEFDLDTGLAIAYTKAMDEELPCFIYCDGCDEDEDDWNDDEDSDEDDNENSDEDDNDYESELLTLDDIKIGTRFIDMDGDLNIKVSETSYYAYTYEETFTIDSDRPFIKTII